MKQNLKAFISHASEDKERFVEGFARKLREKGVDAWLDKWEIMPGDSIVQKIFDEGIGAADVVIIVLSQHSVKKPWVRAELDVAVVKRIQDTVKLIPVVLGDCDIPQPLLATAWQRIEDLGNYDTELQRIVRAIYGLEEKPPLGTPPKYARTMIDVLPGLTKTDSLVLKLAGDKAIEAEMPKVYPDDLWQTVQPFDIPKTDFTDTLEILDRKGYIEVSRFEGDGQSIIGYFGFTDWGFDQYARMYVPDYEAIFKSVVAEIVNRDRRDDISIAKELLRPRLLVAHIFRTLQNQDLITFATFEGDGDSVLVIMDVSPELKRLI